MAKLTHYKYRSWGAWVIERREMMPPKLMAPLPKPEIENPIPWYSEIILIDEAAPITKSELEIVREWRRKSRAT